MIEALSPVNSRGGDIGMKDQREKVEDKRIAAVELNSTIKESLISKNFARIAWANLISQ
ncbi:MAG: hypothetical protein ABIR96_12425 [Bdellovibrionota bacterium]